MGLIDSLSSGLGDALSDPNNAGLLGLAQGLLASSGASRLPVTMGAALGNGLAGAQAGYAGAQKARQDNLAYQLAQSQYGFQKTQNDLFAKIMHDEMMRQRGITPPAAQPAPQPAPSIMSGAGPLGIPVMSGNSGADGGGAPQMPSAPTGGGSIFAPYLQPGQTPGQLLFADKFFPEQSKALAGNLSLTNEQKNSRDPLIGTQIIANLANQTDMQKLQYARTAAAARFGEGSPQVAQIDDAISKANYIAPIDAKPGTPVIDPRTFAVKAFAPKVADGITGNFGDVNGVSTMTNAYPIPGYAPANGGIVGAEQGARENNTFKTVEGANNKKYSGFVGDLINSASNHAAPPIAPGTPAPTSAPYVPGTIPSGALPSRVISNQGTPKKLMADQQEALANQDSVYQASKSAIQKMKELTQNPGIVGTGARFLPDSVATRLSDVAAEYGKQHANFVALQGKALGAGGTDASRATINESVPMWEKPPAARIAGLTAQENQLDLSHVKRIAMNNAFENGDEGGYTSLSKRFDSTITPQMMPQIMHALALPPGPDRANALKALSADPQMRAALSLLAETGALK